ncbi:MAG: alpha/beta fold hydrolase [Gammaproteobacteria bacterium]|nr:alpha/beta fold hydrolase [Gammaproteobacteria bacterium]
MATVVLVHGAWHGSWCWERVRPLLQAAGHRVLAPDLPGHGGHPADVAAQTIPAYIRTVNALVGDTPGEPVVLVGHSLAGIVISGVAEALPDRIQKLVYVTAFLPRDGDSLVRIAGADPDNPLNEATERTPDRKAVTVRPERVRELFYADCSAGDVAFASARLVPESLAAHFGTVETTPARFGRVPRAYIHCRRDRALPLFLQQLMVDRVPCDPVLWLDTGHSPFFAAPELLARHLDSLARGGD